jgi:hypothetical protein
MIISRRAQPPSDLREQAREIRTRKHDRYDRIRRYDYRQSLAHYLGHGYRVVDDNPYGTTVAIGKPVNHGLHLALTILTLGLWALVWVLVALAGGEKCMYLPKPYEGGLVGPPPQQQQALPAPGYEPPNGW